MANFYGTARTNYFEVKDLEAFETAMGRLPDLEIIYNNGLVGLMVDYGDSGCFPSYTYDEENEEFSEQEIDIAEYVAAHLADGAVAIFIQAGAEKLRYVSGYAEAINSKYQRKFVSLDDIYDLAAGLTTSAKAITRAEY